MRFMTVRILLPGALLGAFAAAWGCSADQFASNTATIVGRVENRSGDPITGIRVGVVYQPALLAPGVLPAVSAGPNLAAPYPNPLTDSPGGVKIGLSGVTDTTLGVEIRSEFGGVAGNVRNLFAGRVTQDTTLTWDGLDNTFRLVPNGRYTIRLTVPLNPPAGTTATTQEKTFIVNRSQSVIEFYEAYNAQSDVDGQYVIEDLAVGARFTATNTSGTVLGEAFLPNQVVLMFRDSEFQAYFPAQTTVAVGPQETVDVTTVLDASAASPRPAPAAR